jgi:hypothetical protein
VLDVVPANSCSGHAFPDRYTRWQKGVEGSASHQRIISYQFAGLELLVRFEADGYLEEELRQEEGVDQGATKEREDDTAKERGDDTAEKTIPEIDNIHIRAAGQLISQHAIFELKTRSVNKKSSDQISDHLPRMWTAQIPFCILAFHESGLFKSEDITIQDVREKVAAWQEDNQKLLHQFSVLLKKLVSLARDPEIGKYEVCLQQPGILEIRKQGGKVSSPLPSPLTWIRMAPILLRASMACPLVQRGAMLMWLPTQAQKMITFLRTSLLALMLASTVVGAYISVVECCTGRSLYADFVSGS